MKKFWIAATLVAVLPAFSSAAPPPGNDVLGIYTAEDGTGYANTNAPAFSTVTAHLLLTNCTAEDGISGWECTVDAPPSLLVTDWAINGTSLNIAGEPSFVAGPDFAVGLSLPFGRQDVLLLCTMEILVFNADPAYFYLHPVAEVPSVPGKMVYSRGNNIGELVPMNWSSGSEDLPVFGINTGPLLHVSGRTIPVEDASWGEVKSLYR